MRIDAFILPEDRTEHIAQHGVTPEEVEEVCFGKVDGDKLTGTVNVNDMDSKIEGGKLKGGELSEGTCSTLDKACRPD